MRAGGNIRWGNYWYYKERKGNLAKRDELYRKKQSYTAEKKPQENSWGGLNSQLYEIFFVVLNSRHCSVSADGIKWSSEIDVYIRMVCPTFCPYKPEVPN